MLEQPATRDRLYPRAELAHPYGRGIPIPARCPDTHYARAVYSLYELL
jgi:hypothetical protein